MELKQFIFLALTLVAIPMAAWWGIRFKWAERLLVAAAFFSTCYLVDVNFFSMRFYRGDTRGFEFGITDWMVLALAAVMMFSPRWRRQRPEWLPPNGTPMLTYLMLAFATLFIAAVPLYAGFGVHKIMRAMLVYWVAYNYLRSERDLRFVLLILAAIVAFEFLQVLMQRAGGIYRAHGSMPHSNTLALYINMINMIFLSFVVNDRQGGWQRMVYWAAWIMGSLIVLATFSRGALAVMVLCYGLVLVLSMWDRSRLSKVRTTMLLVLLALPLAIKVAPSVIKRFQSAPVNAELSRQQANTAAIAMANSGLLGIGLNNYSFQINETAFSRYIPSELDRGIVHNIYLLHAAEMGWPGLALFLLLIGNFMWMALRLVLRRMDNMASWMAIGLLVGMTSLWLQSTLEWAFRQSYLTIQFFMLAGFLAALPRVLQLRQRHYQQALLSIRQRASVQGTPLRPVSWVRYGTQPGLVMKTAQTQTRKS
jgi:O-antigen ligase